MGIVMEGNGGAVTVRALKWGSSENILDSLGQTLLFPDQNLIKIGREPEKMIFLRLSLT